MTVLTPTFNRRDMLAKTLASVRYQSYPHIEHIVLDGGSDDGTVDLLRRAEVDWGIRWVSQRDGGMYEALNHGLEMATGAIIGWVNDDDWLLPWSVQLAVSTIASSPRPSAVFGDVLSTEPGGTRARVQVYGRFDVRGLAAGVALAQPTIFWPVEATRLVGSLDTKTYRQIADCEYWLRLAKVVTFHKIDEPMALVHDHSRTKRQTLASTIDGEFAALSAQYNRAPFPKLWLVVDGLRRRWRWSRLLARGGWRVSTASGLIAPSWTSASLCANLLAHGPQRRHPYAGTSVDVSGVRDMVEAAARGLTEATRGTEA